MSTATKSQNFSAFLKFIKRPQTTFYADTMSHSKVIRSRKSQNLPSGQNLSIGQNFLQQFFFSIDILLKLQKQILIYFCKFSCNSDTKVVTYYVIMLCCNLSVGVALNAPFTTNGMCAKSNMIHMSCGQAIIKWSRRVISMVACCHSVKLCALAARAFLSQQLFNTGLLKLFCSAAPFWKWFVYAAPLTDSLEPGC